MTESDQRVGEATPPQTPAEIRLRERLIELQTTVDRLRDNLRIMVIALLLFVIVAGVGGYVTFQATQDGKEATIVNRSQGFGNRQLLCIATSAPGNQIPAEELEKIKSLCDRDFSGAR